MNISTRGFREIEAALSALPSKVARRVLAQGLRAAARPIAAAARANAPRRLGKLKAAIMVASSARTYPARPAVMYVGVRRPRGRISHLIEFGHAIVRGGRVVAHVAARPFLRPALDSQAATGVRRMGEVLFRGIVRELARRGGAS